MAGSLTFHGHATWAKPDGNVGFWSGTIKAPDITKAMQKLKTRLSKRKSVAGKLDIFVTTPR